MNDTIIPGLVESRRKMFSGYAKDTNEVSDSRRLDFHVEQQDLDLAHVKSELSRKDKVIEDLQVKTNLLHTLIAELYQELKEVREELNLIKHRECVIHSDSIASIWKPPS